MVAANLASASHSRQTIQLSCQLRRLLSQHGIEIPIDAPELLVRLLQASSELNAPEIQDCRQRLIEAVPCDKQVHLSNTPKNILVCKICGRTKPVRLAPHARVERPQYEQCGCGVLYQVALNQRQHPRVPAQLAGTYTQEPEGAYSGAMTVEDLSQGGLRMRTETSHLIACGERLRLTFHLDDEAPIKITILGCVRYVVNPHIGVRFAESQPAHAALRAYLDTHEKLQRDKKSRPLQQAHEIMRLPNSPNCR